MPGKKLTLWALGGVVVLGGLLWRATAGGDAVLHRASVRTGLHAGPLALAVDSQAGRVFVATTSATTPAGQPIGNGSVAILDARRGTVLERVALGGSSNAVAVAGATHRAFVATTVLPGYAPTYAGTLVHLLDTRTGAVVRAIRVGTAPVDIAADDRAGHVFVAILGPVTGGAVRAGRGGS